MRYMNITWPTLLSNPDTSTVTVPWSGEKRITAACKDICRIVLDDFFGSEDCNAKNDFDFHLDEFFSQPKAS